MPGSSVYAGPAPSRAGSTRPHSKENDHELDRRRFRTCRRLATAAAAAAFLIGCDPGADGVGTGTLVLRLSGEGAAKQGYPYTKDNGQRLEFVDGWTIRFSKFLVSLGELRVRASDGSEGFVAEGPFVADIQKGDPEIARAAGLKARRWDRFGFKVIAPTAAATNLNGVAAADVERMTAGGFNYWIEGTAEKGGETYAFRWGLANPTRNANCTNGTDNTDGFVVRNNGTTVGEITIHVDHLFWDTLGTEQAKLRFEPIAGASRDDREITFTELAGQRLDNLQGRTGERLKNEAGQPLIYDPGSIPILAYNLQGFMLASSASQAHVNGVGLCTVSSL